MGIETRQWVWIGVDLGQRRDSSAIAVVERVWERAATHDFLSTGLDGQWWFRVRILERLRLDTEYPDVVERVRQIAELPGIRENRTIVVDGTGVGAPVVDLLRRARLGCMIVPIIITGGVQPSTALRNGYESVPRSELLTAMQVLAQLGRLKIATRCKYAEALRREMLELKLAASAQRGEAHDDLALAVALALWKARAGLVIDRVRSL